MTGPSRRSLARTLEGVGDFEVPSVDREQYLTPPEIAAHVCHLAALEGDIAGETVVDLGTGTGMLAIGASHYGPDRVVGVDIDSDALALARSNARAIAAADGSTDSTEVARRTEGPIGIDWIRADATVPPFSVTDATVLSNPPFGARRGNRHADREFLESARSIARTSYTIHNEGSQEFVEAYADDHGATITHAFRAQFPLENRFEFHTSEEQILETEVFRIEW